MIVPVTEDGKFLCVRQFRHGIGEVMTEFPAGGIDPAAPGTAQSGELHESTLECARRELREETGYVSEEWTRIAFIPSDATLSDNYACLFLARNCRKISGQRLDETEDLEPEILTGEEIEILIRAGKFQQSVHVMAYLLALRVLNS